MNEKYQILLYYKYTDIENPEEEKERQMQICSNLSLKGRIIVSKEGINGTVEGTLESTEKYIVFMKENPYFSDISFKKSVGTGNAFPKCSVKVRDEIVSFHLDSDVDPRKTTGKRIKAEELKHWYDKGEEFFIIDMRNEYEHRVGKFKDSIVMPVENFRDIPEHISKFSRLKDKKVLPVCTGGVRCEKASGLLLKMGFKDVYQIEDGIVSFIEKFPNSEFEGSLYVFDGRITMTYDDPKKHKVIGLCDVCGSPTEAFSNCANKTCNKKMLCCSDCKGKEIFCSDSCEFSLKDKAFNFTEKINA